MYTARVPSFSTRGRARCGLTLVEVALFICLVGVLLAVSVPTFLRAIRTSKMAEAPHELARIYAATTAYYSTPQFVAAVAVTRSPAAGPQRASSIAGAASPAAPTERAGSERVHCMPSPAGPTPEKPASEPTQVAFGAPDAPDSATWRALGYEPSAPIRYRYSLLPSASGCETLGEDSHGEVVLSIRAEGDLDADGLLSLFERKVTVQSGKLALDPLLIVRDRVE